MPAHPKPVSRQRILDLAASGIDAFAAQRYLKSRENVPRLAELEEQGQGVIPGAEGVLADLSYALWDPEPSLRDEAETPVDRRYWRGMLGETVASSNFAELHAMTQLSELRTLMGTVVMGETILALVPEEDRPRLGELAERQKQASEQKAQEDQAKAESATLSRMAGEAAEQAEGIGSGQGDASDDGADGSGKPSTARGQLTAEQAQELANQLAERAAEAKAKADELRAQAEEAQLQVEISAEELMGQPGSQEAADKLRELARIGQAATAAASEQVKEISETLECWGLAEGELIREGIPEALEIMRRMSANEAFKKFAAILGRIRKIAARKARSKIAGEGARESRSETGRDLRRAVSSELVALTQPALRISALQRWTRGELRLQGERRREKLGHGPVIALEDGSGSMAGAKQQWAKATTLALAYYARLQKRSFVWVHFGSRASELVVRNYPRGEMPASQLLEIAETFRDASGTDFELPLLRALEAIRGEGLSKADVVLITDGECAVSERFLGEFLPAKRALETNVVSVLCNVGSSSGSTVSKFSDAVEPVSDFTSESAERQVFSRL